MTVRKSAVGQSLVEFALVLPIVALLLMGTLDLGRLFYTKISLTSAAREGAYYLTYYPSDRTNCSGAPAQCFQGTWAAVNTEAGNLGLSVTYANMTVTIYDGVTGAVKTSSINMGDLVQVSVTQTADLFIFNFIRGPVPLTGTVKMLVQSSN